MAAYVLSTVEWSHERHEQYCISALLLNSPKQSCVARVAHRSWQIFEHSVERWFNYHMYKIIGWSHGLAWSTRAHMIHHELTWSPMSSHDPTMSSYDLPWAHMIPPWAHMIPPWAHMISHELTWSHHELTWSHHELTWSHHELTWSTMRLHKTYLSTWHLAWWAPTEGSCTQNTQ